MGSALAGWSSTERPLPGGAVELEQRVRLTEPAVEMSEAGALRLGDCYWREVEAFTHRMVRVARRDDGLELRLFGGCVLLRFGEPEVGVGEGSIESRFPIRGGLLSGRPGGSITFAQTAQPDLELRTTVAGFVPRLLYRGVQRRLHASVSRHYFERLLEVTECR